MKSNVFKNLFRCVLILAVMFLPLIVSAQGPGDPNCDPLNPACPIDGGLSALLAIGAGYGIKKIRDARKTMDPE